MSDNNFVGFTLGDDPDNPAVAVTVEFLPGFNLVKQLAVLQKSFASGKLVDEIITSLDDDDLQNAMNEINQERDNG